MGRKYFTRLTKGDIFLTDDGVDVGRKNKGKYAVVKVVNRSRKNRVTVRYQIINPSGDGATYDSLINHVTDRGYKVDTL